MQTFLIDGFNLIHKIGRMADSASPHQELINRIAGAHLTGSRNNRALMHS